VHFCILIFNSKHAKLNLWGIKMKRIILVLILFVFCSLLYSQGRSDNFNKGISYYLLKDIKKAKNHLSLYFKAAANPQLKSGYMLLLEGKNWEATTRFKDYLGINHRSLVGLVGISLATVDMKNTTTMENLWRATRLNSRYSPAYLCLGIEYMKKRVYPSAERYLNLAIKLSNTPEYKILLGNLYLTLQKPEMTLALVKSEADRFPDNFYFNFLTAQAYLELDNFDNIENYIDSAIVSKPKNQEVQLLRAKYLLKKGNYKGSKSILSNLKFEDFDEEYVKTFAQTLLKLNDKKAKTYLYEFFSKNSWDRDINRMMGEYLLKKDKKANVQNWIYRMILSGNEVAGIKDIFPDTFKIPEFKYLPFFEVKKIKWISNDRLLVVAIVKSGQEEGIFVIDTRNLKIVKTFSYRGSFQNIFLSKDFKNIIFSTTTADEDRIYLYTIEVSDTKFTLRPVFAHPLELSSALIGYNSSGSMAYITDGSISSLAFESPFSQVSLYGRKKPLYPYYPFPVYLYNFSTKRFFKLKNTRHLDQIENIPIRDVRKYALVCRAYQGNSDISDLINKGQQLDLTSSQVVKIHCSMDLSAFIIYLSDLNNAFQALIYNERDNWIVKVDESMFLGKKEYAQVNIIHFDPRENEIILMTQDKNRELIHFNYRSYLYCNLSKNVIEFYFNSDNKDSVSLTERSNNLYYKDTNLELIALNPFYRKLITERRDLNKIIHYRTPDRIYFSTYNGELVKMDDEYNFTYIGPSLEGAFYDSSPDNHFAAVFINGRLFVLNWIGQV